ncbi:MAG TPA: ECF-type sigma factor [Blastocatellia bacterium]|nr:ECF-type sigma factor [Blastocatellia bacterium]HMX28205.1 ECF-type sigma factor [Blastocatellia bacterium]HMZ21828.1 ECF-type sigma factor [Blastocatellia bacterium]HNG33979.1 ECF-type sigma factor [Blastocatellia bacterium]
MATHGSHEITDLLHAWQQGDSAAYDALARLVYAELHRIAAGQLRDERAGHTLNPSALVNEAFVKLCGIRRMEWQDRLHFYRFAARLMRQVLLNYAEARQCGKRGGGALRVDFSEALEKAEQRETDLEQLLALDEALTRLAEQHAPSAQVVELRYFGGLSEAEIAVLLGLDVRTIKRYWHFARLWLRNAIREERGSLSHAV